MDRLIVDPRLRGFGRAAARLISGGLRQLPWGGHGLVFEEVGEEIGILGGQGTELVEERLLGLQLLAERATLAAVEALHPLIPGVTASNGGITLIRRV